MFDSGGNLLEDSKDGVQKAKLSCMIQRIWEVPLNRSMGRLLIIMLGDVSFAELWSGYGSSLDVPP